MMHQVRRIAVIKLAAFMAILYGVLGIPLAGLFMFMATLAPSGGPSPMGAMLGLGAGMLVAVPIAYACLGFIGGLIIGGLYNVVAGWIGGIQIDIEPVSTS